MSAQTLTRPYSSAASPSGDQAHNWLKIVEQQIGDLRFGSVGITVHEGRVVQIETSVKVRFDKTV